MLKLAGILNTNTSSMITRNYFTTPSIYFTKLSKDIIKILKDTSYNPQALCTTMLFLSSNFSISTESERTSR